MIEFKLITGVELNEIDPQGVQWPWDTLAIVALQDGKCVGRLAVMNLPVLEGWYVDPEFRGEEMANELTNRVEELMRSRGYTHTTCASRDDQPEVRRYIKLHDYEEQPLRVFMKDLKTEKVKAA